MTNEAGQRPDNLPPNLNRSRTRRHRRWLWGLLAAAAAVVIAAALHRPLLRGVAAFLIDERPIVQADYLVLLPSILENASAAREGARRYSTGEVHGILLFEPPISRSVRCGAWPDPAATLRRQLMERGVPASAIVVTPQPCRTTRDAAEAVRNWLSGRPPTRLIVVGPQLCGRYDQRIFDSVLNARQSAAVQCAAIPSGVDENNWWHSREGIQLIFQNYAALAFVWWNGQTTQCRGAWTLEEFENRLPAPADH